MAANRFKMKWVRGGAHYGSIDIYQPVIDYDITGPFYYNPVEFSNWDDASTHFKNNTQGIFPEGCPSNVSVGAHTLLVGNHGYDLFFPEERENIINMGELSGNDKLIMSNGSYWLVTRGAYQDGSYVKVELEGHLESGEIAYSGIVWECSGVGHWNASCTTLPWLMYHNPQYRITSIMATGWGNSGTCNYNTSSTYDPISATLGGRFWSGLTPDPEPDPDDPYPDIPDGGDDFPDEPDGDPDPDPIPIPPDPPIDVQNVGFIRLFAPTESQLTDLASYMWSSAFSLDSFKKIFADPMDCILGLNIVPVNVPRGAATAVKVGNISTGIQMYPATQQWITVDCGSLDVGKIFDTYLDYAPYTKWSLFLPYIGMVQLNTDDVAHKVLKVVYKVDILSCACIAFVKSGDSVLYHFAGSCGYSVPTNSSNFGALYQSIVDVGVSAAMLAVTVGTAGAGAPAAGTAAAARAEASAARMVASQQAHLATSTASAVTNAKPVVKRSGAVGAGSGIMDSQTPYVIIEHPRPCKAGRQAHYIGYPGFVTVQLSGIKAPDDEPPYYAQFESVILNGLSCTTEELLMIEETLKGGVYV